MLPTPRLLRHFPQGMAVDFLELLKTRPFAEESELCMRLGVGRWDLPPFTPNADDVSRLARDGALTVLVKVSRSLTADWPRCMPDGQCWVFAVDAAWTMSEEGSDWRQLLVAPVSAIRDLGGNATGAVRSAYSELKSVVKSAHAGLRQELTDGSGVWATQAVVDLASAVIAKGRIAAGDAAHAATRATRKRTEAADGASRAAFIASSAAASSAAASVTAAGATAACATAGSSGDPCAAAAAVAAQAAAVAAAASATASAAAAAVTSGAEPAASAASAASAAVSAAASATAASKALLAAASSAAAEAAALVPKLLVKAGPRLRVVARDDSGTEHMFAAARFLTFERICDAGWVAIPAGTAVGADAVVLSSDMCGEADRVVPALAGEKVARLFLAIVRPLLGDASEEETAGEAVLFVANGELRLWRTGGHGLHSSFRQSVQRFKKQINDHRRVTQVTIDGRIVHLKAWAEERYTGADGRQVSLDGDSYSNYRIPFAALFGLQASEAFPIAGGVVTVRKSRARCKVKARGLDDAAHEAMDSVHVGAPSDSPAYLSALSTVSEALIGFDEAHDHLAICLFDAAAAQLLSKRPGAGSYEAVRAVTRRVPGGSAVLDLRLRKSWLDAHVPAVPDMIEPEMPDVVSISSHIAFASGASSELTAQHVGLPNTACYDSVGAVPIQTAARGLLMLSNQDYVTASPEVVGGDILILQWMFDLDLVHLIMRGTITPSRLSEMLWFASCKLHSWDDTYMGAVAHSSPGRFSPGARDGAMWAAAG